MAAPVGHIVCALAFLNSGAVDIADRNAFLVGTNFPDIRYISGIHRSATHKVDDEDLTHVLMATTSFEAGRRFHVFVDREREKYMRKHNAYRFLKNGALKKQMLKIIEDHIMFKKLKDTFEARNVFNKIYEEERSYSIDDKELKTWHLLLMTYLNQTYWFNFLRYYKTLIEFQKAYGLPSEFFGNFWQSIKTLGFFVYAYFQVESLSRNQELRDIILNFYENKIQKIIRPLNNSSNNHTVKRHSSSSSLIAMHRFVRDSS
jgi:hypothetical protein